MNRSPAPGVSAIPRLSLEASKQFARLFRGAMAERGFRSVYSLYLATDFARATVDRWLSGRVRIPVGGAWQLIEVLAGDRAADPSIVQLRELVTASTGERTPEEHLRAELRARRVPVQRTLAALRAAHMLPAEVRHELR